MSNNLPDEHLLKVRNLTVEDYEDVAKIMNRVYPDIGGAWKIDEFAAQIKRFPQGQICIEDKGRVVAGALALIIRHNDYRGGHKYRDVVNRGYLRNHNPDGDCLYGIDIFVDQDYQGLRLGRRLYDARKELCEELNLRGILLGGRIPGYRKYAEKYSIREYIELVKNREIHDPVLSFQLANEFHVRRIMKNYLPEDEKSGSYGILLEWNNVYYEEDAKLFGKKSYLRLAVIQWQMRLFSSVDDFLQQVEFFVDTVAGYKADIVLFPELFNAPLMAEFQKENPAEAMRLLADYTETIRTSLLQMAVAYNINIVTGSMPEYEEHSLHNVSFLCRRDGTWDKQYKIHITPDERYYWGLQGGDRVKVFETDVGKVGILICYDVEFPELARHLADQGMEILLVPFWTDTKNSYLRVRRCAQARAIENECFVGIAGSVGNLPKVENMDIQYSQAAIFTPSDFAFPHDAVAAEATPNTEMTLLADLDLDQIMEVRAQGSVRNLESRRKDLYTINWRDKSGR